MSKEKGKSFRFVNILAIWVSLTLIALRANDSIEWAWYWLVLPIFAVIALTITCAFVASIMEEMAKD